MKIKSLLKHIIVQILLFATLGVIYAAWDDAVSNGDALSSSNWNTLVSKVKGLDDTIKVSAGKVGIGTTNPTTNLDIQDTSGPLEISLKHSGNGNTDYSGVSLNNNNGVVGYFWAGSSNYSTQTNWANRSGILAAANSDGLMLEAMTNDIHFYNTGNQSMIIKNNGNVGIGAIDPLGQLHIANDSAETSVLVDGRQFSGGWSLLEINDDSYPVLALKNNGYRYDIANYAGGLAFIDQNQGGEIRLFVQDSTGNVGVGKGNPSYTLDVNGTIRGNNVSPSDQRLKKNITPLKNSLDQIQKIRGVSFDWKNEEQNGKKEDIGFIAQELEKVYPELVSTDIDGIKSVDYSKMTAVLVEAIKEQQKTIQTLEQRLDSLEQK